MESRPRAKPTACLNAPSFERRAPSGEPQRASANAGSQERNNEKALCHELRRRDIHFRRQLEGAVIYRGAEVGLHRLDLLVADEVVVEVKTVKHFDSIHFVVLRSYLRALGQAPGLLLNFAQPTLQIKRVGTRSGPAVTS